MRALVVVAVVLDGGAAIVLLTAMALGDGRMTSLDGLVLCALLLGFFAALGTAILTDSPAAREDDATALLLAGATMFDRMPDEAKEELRLYLSAPTAPIRVRDEDVVDPSVLLGVAIVHTGGRRSRAAVTTTASEVPVH